MLIGSIFSICVLASTPPTESKWAFITSSQSNAYSGEVNGTYKVFGGDNYANSEHALTICSQYKEVNEWKYDKKIRVGINQTLNDTNTTFKSFINGFNTKTICTMRYNSIIIYGFDNDTIVNNY